MFFIYMVSLYRVSRVGLERNSHDKCGIAVVKAERVFRLS